ncbi:sensor histidine kinase [Streptomyces litchfieldiae]|uniref:histidine kinase n=1 Tax=Streptomyces litchfieldiae TaxID=3075543 RepID=A0ABU2MQV6_9ACTN|nr:histidine kinase [Streptomyces sp. DSM 44938]MDT0344015.1 histidine kinase [Streptomyces sp. DSM 44938]
MGSGLLRGAVRRRRAEADSRPDRAGTGHRRRLSGRIPLADLMWWCLVLVGMLTINLPFPPSGGYVAVMVGATAAAAVLSRTFQPGALALTLGLAQWDERFYGIVALAAFLIGRHTVPGARPLRWLAVTVVPVGVMVLRSEPLVGLAALPVELLTTAVLPWLVGRYQYQRLALNEAGWDRAAQLEREQAMVAEQTRLRERARIAQDMHDSLGHDLSLLAIRAGALEFAAGLSEPQRTQAAELRAGAAAATERLHEIIGVLREDDEPSPVDPVHESVDDLVERCRASGMKVELDRSGDPSGLPPIVDQALHRIAQEALTNAAKHAPGAPVRLSVVHTDDSIVLEIVNGPPEGAAPAAGSGRGLASIRERARLLGGDCAAGPAEGGGFRVEARLPHHVAHPVPAPEPAVAERVAQQRHTMRRGFLKSLGFTGAAMVVTASAYFFVQGTPTLDEEVYARMRVGQLRADLAPLLPDQQAYQRPDREPPVPAGAACEYYAAGESPLPNRVYRLCFRDGRLVSRDEIPLDRDE